MISADDGGISIGIIFGFCSLPEYSAAPGKIHITRGEYISSTADAGIRKISHQRDIYKSEMIILI